jgi:hypothetical protein
VIGEEVNIKQDVFELLFVVIDVSEQVAEPHAYEPRDQAASTAEEKETGS